MPLLPRRSQLSVPGALLRLGVSGGLAASAVTGIAAAAAPAPAVAQPAAPAAVAPAAVTPTALPSLPGLLTIGSHGNYVALAQSQLGVARDGIFGPITRSAVRRFQGAHGLATDGVIGPLTWTALSRSKAPSRTSKAAAHTRTTRPVLRSGDRGQAVAQLQRQLGVHADGIFGPNTRSAVRGFQTSHGLSVDGIVGAHTWAALKSGAPRAAAAATVARAASSLGQRAVRIAAKQAGTPYVWGGASPSAGFDCSGLVKYVFGRLGHSLPHNADMQYHAVRHVPKSAARPGDIVFIANSAGHITHDGIYAGNGHFWAAPHTGTVVQKERIYTSRYYVGRVG